MALTVTHGPKGASSAPDNSPTGGGFWSKLGAGLGSLSTGFLSGLLPDNEPNDNLPQQQPQNNNTIIYVIVGALVLLISIFAFKK